MIRFVRDLFLLPAILRRAADAERERRSSEDLDTLRRRLRTTMAACNMLVERVTVLETDRTEAWECIGELAAAMHQVDPGWGGLPSPEVEAVP